MLGEGMTASVWFAALVPGLPAMLRAAGAAMLVPAFTGIGTFMRAGLAVAAAAIAWPMGARASAPEGSAWIWAPQELAAGLMVGAVAAGAAGALRLAGRLAGEQMGLGMGEAVMPDQRDGEGNAAESMLGWCSAACFVAVGGIEGVVISAARPSGEAAAWGLGPTGIATVLDAATSVALRVSLPMMALGCAGVAIGGVLTRAAPGVITLVGGFGVRAAAGLGMLAATATGLWAVQSELVRGVLARLGGGVA